MKLSYQEKAHIRTIKQLIDSMPMQRIPISDLMDKSGLPEEKLTKGFKLLFGKTIYNYQLHLAMVEAARLLEKGALIKSVALATGYKNSRNFARAFSKVFKVTPGQYRKSAMIYEFDAGSGFGD